MSTKSTNPDPTGNFYDAPFSGGVSTRIVPFQATKLGQCYMDSGETTLHVDMLPQTSDVTVQQHYHDLLYASNLLAKDNTNEGQIDVLRKGWAFENTKLHFHIKPIPDHRKVVWTDNTMTSAKNRLLQDSDFLSSCYVMLCVRRAGHVIADLTNPESDVQNNKVRVIAGTYLTNTTFWEQWKIPNFILMRNEVLYLTFSYTSNISSINKCSEGGCYLIGNAFTDVAYQFRTSITMFDVGFEQEN